MDATPPGGTGNAGNVDKKTLSDLYEAVQKHPEVIPTDVTEFFLRRAGFECQDPVVAKMISLAAQKFLADLAKESYGFSKKRQSLTAQAANAKSQTRRNVLLLEDVAHAAGKFGVKVMKPEYFADSVTAGLTTDTQPVAAPTHGEKRGAAPPAAAAAAARKKKKN